jgi:YVTN family beta-propeller protein
VLSVALLAILTGLTCQSAKRPSVPVVTGPDAGVAGVPLTFKATSEDPDGDSVAFMFDWGDTTTKVWANFILSGETISVSHFYVDSGGYSVKVKAENGKVRESDWSSGLQVSVVARGGEYPDTVIQRIPVSNGASALALSPDGMHLYVAHGSYDWVSAVRLPDGQVEGRASTDREPVAVAALPSGDYIVVACAGSGTLDVIRDSDMVVVKRTSVGTNPRGLAVTPDGAYVLVTSSQDNEVRALRTSDYTVVDSVGVGYGPTDVVIDPLAGQAFVACAGTDSIYVIRYQGLSVVGTIYVGAHPCYLAASPDCSYLCVGSVIDRSIREVRLSDHALAGSASVGRTTYGGLSVLPGGEYACMSTGYGVHYLQLDACQFVDSVGVGRSQGGIAVGVNAGVLYMADYDDVFVLGRKR